MLFKIIYCVLLVVLAVCIKKSFSAPVEHRWDPYAVLGLKAGASVKEVKSSFRTLSRRLHPDKNPSPDAMEKYLEVQKAYEALTNDDLRENWEKWGNPDGRQDTEVETALPSFLGDRKYSSYVLLFYGVLLIGVPTTAFVVLQSWKSKTITKVDRTSMEVFAYFLKGMAKPQSLVELICASVEMKNICKFTREDVDMLKKVEIETPVDCRFNKKNRNSAIDAPFVIKSSTIINAHINGVHEQMPEKARKELNEKYMPIVPTLIGGLMTISAARYNLGSLISEIHLLQSIVQGFAKKYQLAQLPGVTEDVCEHFAQKRFNNLTSLDELYALDEARFDRYFEMEHFDKDGIACVKNVMRQLPFRNAVDVSFTIPDDANPENITEGAIMTCTVRLTRAAPPAQGEPFLGVRAKPVADASCAAKEGKEGGSTAGTEEEAQQQQQKKKKTQNDDGEKVPIDVHSPYFPFERTEKYYVILADVSKNFAIGVASVVPSFDKPVEAKLVLEAPEKGSYNWTVFVIPDCYIGLDIKKDVTLHVKPQEKPADAAQASQTQQGGEEEEEEFDDDYDDLTSDDDTSEEHDDDNDDDDSEDDEEKDEDNDEYNPEFGDEKEDD